MVGTVVVQLCGAQTKLKKGDYDDYNKTKSQFKDIGCFHRSGDNSFVVNITDYGYYKLFWCVRKGRKYTKEQKCSFELERKVKK